MTRPAPHSSALTTGALLATGFVLGCLASRPRWRQALALAVAGGAAWRWWAAPRSQATEHPDGALPRATIRPLAPSGPIQPMATAPLAALLASPTAIRLETIDSAPPATLLRELGAPPNTAEEGSFSQLFVMAPAVASARTDLEKPAIAPAFSQDESPIEVLHTGPLNSLALNPSQRIRRYVPQPLKTV